MMEDNIFDFINIHFPDEFKVILSNDSTRQTASFVADRANELRTLKIHSENAQNSGLHIAGISEVIISLERFHEEKINIINIRNSSHFLKIYSDVLLRESLGCILLKLRKKTPEELRWGRDVLGIKTQPPDIEE